MEEGKTKQEVDELEKLLGEIPNATSGNLHSDNSIITDSSADLEGISLGKEERKSSPAAAFANFYHATPAIGPSSNAALSFGKPNNGFVNSSHGSFSRTLQTHGSLVVGKIGLRSGHQTPIKIVESEDSNLPSEQSLTSAFAEMSFKDGVAIEVANSQRVNHKLMPNQTFLPEEKYANCLMKSLSPSSHSPNTVNGTTIVSLPSNGFDQFNVEMNDREIADFPELDDQAKKHKAGSCQPLAEQVKPSLLSVPVPRIEVPVVPYEQQYFSRLQYPLPQMQSQELSHSHIPWLHIEEERYFRMRHKFLHLQQLQNQLSEAQNQTQAIGNATNGPRTRNINQSYINVPFSYQYEHLDGKPCQNDDAIYRGLNRSGPTLTGSTLCRYYAQGFCRRGEYCPFVHGHKKISPSSLAKDFDATQDFCKVGKQNFPEKILTRKNGLNSVKTIKFNSVGENALLKHSSSNRMVLPNGHLHHNAPILRSGSFQPASWNLWGPSPDTKEGRHKNLGLQPHRYNSVDEVTGRIYFVAKDQYGCRFLQRKLTEGTAEDVGKIFLEIVGHIVELMSHPFGNYLVQKLLEVCDEDQRIQIVNSITVKAGDLVRISCNMHGTRAVQKVIETIRSPEQISMIVSSLMPGIVSLIKDMNGNHVAQRCLQHLMPGYIEFLFEAVTAHCVELATDRHGCCVLQKCIVHSDGEQRRRLISEIASNALILSQDTFGNYAVQCVVELEVSWATVGVHDQLEGNYGYLSMQKYSSNVVEKYLKYAGEEHLPFIIQEFIDNPQLDQIMQDPYGNYVIQAALNHSKGSLHAALLEAIRPHIPALRTSPYGKKVLSSIGLKK